MDEWQEDETATGLAADNVPAWHSVGVGLADRAYGGPEEGGWYFDCWEPSQEYGRFTKTFKTAKQAAAYVDRLNRHLCAPLNKGRPEIWSVLSQGRYEAEIFEDTLPVAYPACRPHYE